MTAVTLDSVRQHPAAAPHLPWFALSKFKDSLSDYRPPWAPPVSSPVADGETLEDRWGRNELLGGGAQGGEENHRFFPLL